MKITGRRLLGVLLAAFMVVPMAGGAEGVRKAKSSPPPEYPELAQRLNIRGTAKVRATVAPDGTVREVQDMGGNPVLVDALVRAVKKWKYEPSDKTTLVDVRFDFPQ